MNDIPPPAQRPSDPAAQDPNAPKPADGNWAAGVFSGPAGWPGAIHADYSMSRASAEPAPREETPPIQTPAAAAPIVTPPVAPVQAPIAVPISAPAPQPRVEEVEARPISFAEKRGPTIDAPPAVRVEQAPSATQAPLFPPQPVYEATARASGSPNQASGAQPAAAPFQAAAQTSSPAFSTAPQATQPTWSNTGAASAAVPPTANGATIPPAPDATSAARPFARPASPFWTAILHLAYLIPLPLHIAGLVVTALIWVWRRGRDPHIEQQGRESLNFQLTYFALNAALTATCIGIVAVPVVWIAGAVLCVVAAVRAAEGERYRYPWIFRLIA